MPSHAIHSALAALYLDANGAPWTFELWQAITHVFHGLFPPNDAQLPKGWSREDANFVRSYFDQYSRKPTEDDRIKFASSKSNAQQVPGRDIWRKWVVECWKDSKIHARITEVLSTNNLHPLAIARASSDGPSLDWPNGSVYIPLAVDAVAQALFGDEVLDRFHRAPPRLRPMTQALIQRTWVNIYNQVNRSRARLANYEKDAMQAFQNLDRNQLTKKKLRAVIVKVARWKALAEILYTEEHTKTMEDMEDELKHLMVGLGAKLAVPSQKKASNMTKVNAKALQSLASEEDVADVIDLYLDFFESPSVADSVPLQQQQPTIRLQLAKSADGLDPGTEFEAKMSPEELAHNLGFTRGLPLLFNVYRHQEGLSAWDNADLFDPSKATENPEMEPLTLHWHQLSGTHAVLRMNFTPEPIANHRCGSLITDEVGLGKTFLAASTVACLSDVVMRQEMEAPLPPLFKSNPYLGDCDKVPNLPHLIIAPGTLLSQWESELKVVLKPRSFDILMYGLGKVVHEKFWRSDRPFYTSKHNPSQKIIIASHSALQQDFSSLYSWSKPASDKLPWAHPPKLADYAKNVSKTLFGQRFLSITLDEAHAFRNVGAKHSAALLILEQAVLRLIMTATPLQTSTKDIAAMGRLVGLPHFFSKDALDAERTDISNIRRMRVEGSEEDDAANQLQIEVAQKLQQRFEGRILRRTRDSLDWKGKPLITIPPYKETMVMVTCTEREMEIISELADNEKENLSAANGMLQKASQNFYIRHRIGVGYARLNIEEKIPTFATLEDWEAKKSTKIDTCVRMVKHLLTRDDAPAMIFENGGVTYPPIPPPKPGEKVSQRKKIIIYQEFPSLGSVLRNVLDLYGIRHLTITGQTTIPQRAKIVKAFRCDPLERVLIISSVGSNGLNLTMASTIFYLDQPWSAQDERQIRGRAHRQPQKEVVENFHILANDTADIILASLARGKHAMMEAFLKQERGQEMFDLLSGKTIARQEDFYDENDLEYREIKRQEKRKEKEGQKAQAKAKKGDGVNEKDEGRPKKRRSKKVIDIVGDDEDEQEPTGSKTGTDDMHVDDPVALPGLDTDLGELSDGSAVLPAMSDSEGLTDTDKSMDCHSMYSRSSSLGPSKEPVEPAVTPPQQTGVRRSVPSSPEARKDTKRPRLVEYLSSPTDRNSFGVVDSEADNDVFGPKRPVSKTMSGERHMAPQPTRERHEGLAAPIALTQGQVHRQSTPPFMRTLLSQASTAPPVSSTLRQSRSISIMRPTPSSSSQRSRISTPQMSLERHPGGSTTTAHGHNNSTSSPIISYPSSSSPASSSQGSVLGPLSMRQPTLFGRPQKDNGRLSPPPPNTKSNNPFRKNPQSKRSGA